MSPNGSRIEVAKKMAETPFFIETLTNKFNGERQIQVNDTYEKDGEFLYARRGVNINVIDVPEVVAAMIKLYEAETGKKVEL